MNTIIAGLDFFEALAKERAAKAGETYVVPSAIQEFRDREAIYKAECAITEKMDLVGKMKVALMKPTQDGGKPRNWFEEFNPWRDVMNGVFIGSYSSAFDELALTVLRDMRDDVYNRNPDGSLAYELFQEALCCLGLADYGSSPRCCWADHKGFSAILPAVIAKWEEYACLQWNTDEFKKVTAHQQLAAEQAFQVCRYWVATHNIVFAKDDWDE